jgi:hypothetical protein
MNQQGHAKLDLASAILLFLFVAIARDMESRFCSAVYPHSLIHRRRMNVYSPD